MEVYSEGPTRLPPSTRGNNPAVWHMATTLAAGGDLGVEEDGGSRCPTSA
jgi:hypothetical protein